MGIHALMKIEAVGIIDGSSWVEILEKETKMMSRAIRVVGGISDN